LTKTVLNVDETWIAVTLFLDKRALVVLY
jgi:hypothetical protein